MTDAREADCDAVEQDFIALLEAAGRIDFHQADCYGRWWQPGDEAEYWDECSCGAFQLQSLLRTLNR
jgi:hypothetical protein